MPMREKLPLARSREEVEVLRRVRARPRDSRCPPTSLGCPARDRSACQRAHVEGAHDCFPGDVICLFIAKQAITVWMTRAVSQGSRTRMLSTPASCAG